MPVTLLRFLVRSPKKPSKPSPNPELMRFIDLLFGRGPQGNINEFGSRTPEEDLTGDLLFKCVLSKPTPKVKACRSFSKKQKPAASKTSRISSTDAVLNPLSQNYLTTLQFHLNSFQTSPNNQPHFALLHFFPKGNAWRPFSSTLGVQGPVLQLSLAFLLFHPLRRATGPFLGHRVARALQDHDCHYAQRLWEEAE